MSNEFDKLFDQEQGLNGLSGGLSSLVKEVKRAGRKIDDELHRVGDNVKKYGPYVAAAAATLAIPGVGAALVSAASTVGGAISAGVGAIGTGSSSLVAKAATGLKGLKVGSILTGAAKKAAVSTITKELAPTLGKAGISTDIIKPAVNSAVDKITSGEGIKFPKLSNYNVDDIVKKVTTSDIKKSIENNAKKLLENGMSPKKVVDEVMRSELTEYLINKSGKLAVEQTIPAAETVTNKTIVNELKQKYSDSSYSELKTALNNIPKSSYSNVASDIAAIESKQVKEAVNAPSVSRVIPWVGVISAIMVFVK
jgi:hypothetical protein